jgi:tRNA(fMet)-specific endonuclease VapC
VRILIDTNRYRDFCEGDVHSLEVIRCAEKILMPFAVIAELRAGFLCGTKSRENEKYLTMFLNSDRVKAMYPDDNTTHHFAQIFAQLRLQATPIPVNDIWIASLAIQHDLMLFSRDVHFDRLPQLAQI